MGVLRLFSNPPAISAERKARKCFSVTGVQFNGITEQARHDAEVCGQQCSTLLRTASGQLNRARPS